MPELCGIMIVVVVPGSLESSMHLRRATARRRTADRVVRPVWALSWSKVFRNLESKLKVVVGMGTCLNV